MGAFNPNDYESVKARKQRFLKDHPDGRIVPDKPLNSDLMEMAVIYVRIYKNKQDQLDNCAFGSGMALEIRDKTLSKNQYGKEYESVNYSSWLENAEESAVGRALDNCGYASNAKCSRDEIEKAQRNAQAIKGMGITNPPNQGQLQQKTEPPKEDPVQPFNAEKITQRQKLLSTMLAKGAFPNWTAQLVLDYTKSKYGSTPASRLSDGEWDQLLEHLKTVKPNA